MSSVMVTTCFFAMRLIVRAFPARSTGGTAKNPKITLVGSLQGQLPAETGTPSRSAAGPTRQCGLPGALGRSAATGCTLVGAVEVDVDLLETFRPLGLRRPGVGTLVAAGEIDVVGEGGEQGARVEPVDAHDVDLDAEEHGDGGEIEEGQQPEDGGEDAVGGAGALDDVADVDAAEGLQQLPGDGSGECSGQ